MYTPAAFAMAPGRAVVEVLRQQRFGHLVTSGPPADDGSGLQATALPFTVDDDASCVRAHFARANPHWDGIDGQTALLIVPGLDAYVSPRWYPSKTDHGKVVPTSNYELVHLHGVITIHHDDEWKRQVVDDLTRENEGRVSDPEQRESWKTSDAPETFVAAQLRRIVGVELSVTKIEAKQKFSQNKPGGDRHGAQAGLARSTASSDVDMSERMRATE